MTWNEEDDEDSDLHPEGPDASDLNDDPAEVPCPYCGREIPDDTPRCPYCGNYLSREDAPPKRHGWWFVGLGLLIALILAFLVRHGW